MNENHVTSRGVIATSKQSNKLVAMTGVVLAASGTLFLQQGNNVEEQTTGLENGGPDTGTDEPFLGLERGIGSENGIPVKHFG